MENQNERSKESLELQEYIKTKAEAETKVQNEQETLRKSFK